MKHLITIISLLATLTSAAQNQTCTLRATLPQKMAKGMKQITLNVTIDTEKGDVSIGSLTLSATADSLLSGTFTCPVTEPRCGGATWADDPHVGFTFILEPGTVNVTVDKSYKSTVGGTPLNDAYTQFQADIDHAGRQNSYYQQADSIERAYLRRYGDTPLFGRIFSSSVHVMRAMFGGSEVKQKVEEIWAMGSDHQHKVKSVLNTYNRICHNDIANGMPLRDVAIPNATVEGGKTVRLSDIIGRGKWVFVDFWASWCVGCRQAIPRVKEAYEMFKDKNIDFVSIAVWDKRPAALKAIKEENMPWLQLIDEKGLCGEAYMFNAIPRLMLFAPDGTLAEKQADSRALIPLLEKKLITAGN